MNTEAEIVGIKKDIDYLKTCCSKMDSLKNGDSAQNQTLSELRNQIELMGAGMDRHLEWHDKQDLKAANEESKKDNKKWDVLKIIIALVITTVGTTALSKLF